MSKGDGICRRCQKPTMYGRHLNNAACEPDARSLLTRPQEVVRESENTVTTRPAGTDGKLTITWPKGRKA